ncbi:GmrSD restriction endonuclease domain-containing protein [Flavobacterium sp. GCM10023249]|uniref:GmrSD restriction endonuclease domain-containing protein n=1 Tax=unclassified Flavobacterium TaxID=196869 RepID=UPI00360C9776
MKISFWKLISQNKIEIPIIQRDYAQGRKEESRIANGFIAKIKSKILKNEILNLDFVYGKTSENKFIPLDGQQRLTTLFLLHWYIATKEGKITQDVKDVLVGFSYETRASSQDFCKNLVLKGIVDFDKIKIVSDQIEDQKWFSLSWKSDPTIKAILNMLDIIQNQFLDVETSLFENLIGEKCSITFNYLPLDKFKLTDELYIKMNSRGKPLTEFENFKANFSYFLHDDEKSKLDNDWYDIFWKLESLNESLEIKNIDNQFYNFFHNLTLNFYVEKNDADKSFLDSYYLFEHYESVYHNSNSSIAHIKEILDALRTYPDGENYFKDFIKSTSISYWERVRFYALTKFFISQGEINQSNKTVYENWMRVCCNLINNTLIQSPTEYYTAIRSVNQLSKGLNDVYNYILGNNFVSGFIKNQQEEERIKVELIQKQDFDWEKEILKIEKNLYFDGQIGFILNYAKVNGTYDLDTFRNYANKLDILFTNFKENNEFLFQRALLACGNYIVDNKTFCNFELGLRAKNDNWRKVFNDENKTLVLKTLLDHIQIETIEEDLNMIIKNYSENDWKNIFINNKEILPYCCNYQIKMNFEKIYLSRSHANNWKRKAELYTYDFFTTIIRNKPIQPFTNSDYHETVDEPCAFLDQWTYNNKHNFALDIFIYENSFVLSFFDRNENEYPETLVDLLNNLRFEQEGNRYYLNTGIKEKNAVIILLKTICSKFGEMNLVLS